MKSFSFVFFLSFLCSLLRAQSFDMAISKAMQNNSKIKALQIQIEKLEDEAKIARKWDNPNITLGYNALYPNHPAYRDDAMQSISISLAQKFDLFAKKPIEGQKISLQKQIKILELKSLQKNIIKDIKIRMIRSDQDKKRIEILKSTLNNISLFKRQIDSNSSDFLLDEIYKIEILETRIRLKLNQFLQNQKEQVIEFNEITFQENQEIDFNPTFQKFWGKDYYKSSYELLIQKYKEQIEDENIALAKRSFWSDPTFSLGYFHRKNHQDFLSFGVSFSLPIYGKEVLILQNAHKQSQITKNTTLEIENKIKSKIKKLQNTLEKKGEELVLIESKLLPNAKKLLTLYQKNISSSKSAMGAYHQALNDLLEAELLRIDVKGGIWITLCELESIGEER